MGPHRRRGFAALAVVLAAALLGLVPSSAVAADCPAPMQSCVVVSVVKTVDGTQEVLNTRVFSPADLTSLTDADLNTRRYLLRKNPKSKGGKLEDKDVARGSRVSVNTLLTTLDPALVGQATYVETPNSAGVPSVLTPAELADPAAASDPSTPYPFADALPPVVFSAGDSVVGFIRPLRDVDEDANGGDYTRITGRLDITVHTTGGLLAPTVSSSNGTELDLKGETTFSAAFAETPRSRVLSTRWDFGDGSTKATKREKPSKSYAKKGAYPVVVTVRTNDGSYGRSAPLEVKVAKPPKAPTSGTGGGDGFGGPGGTGNEGPGLPSPFDPSDGLDFEAPDDLEEPPVEVDPEPTIPVDDGLVPVEGFVLAGAEIVPGGTPETIPGTQTSTTPAAATQATMRQRIATWVVAVLAVALLLGMGAASETRWFRHRLRHLRRRA